MSTLKQRESPHVYNILYRNESIFIQRECLCAAHRLSLVTNVVLTGFTH